MARGLLLRQGGRYGQAATRAGTRCAGDREILCAASAADVFLAALSPGAVDCRKVASVIAQSAGGKWTEQRPAARDRLRSSPAERIQPGRLPIPESEVADSVVTHTARFRPAAADRLAQLGSEPTRSGHGSRTA